MKTPSVVSCLCMGVLLGLGLGCGPADSAGTGDGVDAPPGSGDTDGSGGDDDNDDNDDGDDNDNGDVPDAMDCANIQVELSAVVPTVMLVVDRSGSMDFDFGDGFFPPSRWDALYDTLMATPNGVVAELESDVRFGLALYSENNDACPLMSTVAPALDNYSAIDDVYGDVGPLSGTPTGPAVEQATDDLAAVTAPGPKILVLATDGEPATCDNLQDEGTPEAQQESVDAVTRAYDMGIETYVVSVGDDIADQHLQDVANAGVGLAVGGSSNAPFYKALEPAELVAAFDEIIGGVRSCTFSLDGMIDPAFASQGTVVLDGEVLQHGTEWDLSDSMTLVILGAACDSLLAGGEHTLSAEFPCGASPE